MSKVLVPLIDGFEETEAIASIDIMRRGGLNVVTAGIGKKEATGSHKITVQCDALYEEASELEFDAIVLPGGPGTKNLNEVDGLHDKLTLHYQRGKLIGAICAAPSILANVGLLEGKQVSCHASVNDKLKGGKLSDQPVSEDGNIITSQGVGTAVPFGLSIVAKLVSREKADEIAKAIHFAGW